MLWKDLPRRFKLSTSAPVKKVVFLEKGEPEEIYLLIVQDRSITNLTVPSSSGVAM